MTSITGMVGAITLTFEQLRDWWDMAVWKASPEYREMIHARLLEHDEAMRNNTKSPYFDYD